MNRHFYQNRTKSEKTDKNSNEQNKKIHFIDNNSIIWSLKHFKMQKCVENEIENMMIRKKSKDIWYWRQYCYQCKED